MAHPLTKILVDFNKLKKELALTNDEKVFIESYLKAAFDGDYWQDGKGYLGPPPTPNQPGSDLLKKAFEQRFVSRNVLLEVVDRVSGVFLGKSPNINFVVDGEMVESITEKRSREIREAETLPIIRSDPSQDPASDPNNREFDLDGEGNSDEDTKLLEEIEKALRDIWTSQGIDSIVNTAFNSRLAGGRGGIRVFIPNKYIETESDEKGNVASVKLKNLETFQQALKAIRIEYIKPEQSRLFEDGGWYLSIVHYTVRKDWETDKLDNVIEVSYVDDDDNTRFVTFEIEKTESAKMSIEDNENKSDGFDLGGYPSFFELTGRPYISEQLFKNNALYNLALTLAGFGLVQAGFSEMVMTNVELEYESVPDPTVEGGFRQVPRAMQRGGGVTQNLLGMEYTDMESAVSTRADPKVFFKEPSPLTSFKDGKDLAYQACLEEAKQLHVLISGDAMASAASRVQAMSDFYLAIKKYKSEIDQLGTWLMTVIFKLAAELCGKAQVFASTTINFDSQLRVGNLTADEKRLIIEMNVKGLVSNETAMVMLEIDDPILEKEKIAFEAEQKENKNVERQKKLIDEGLQMPPDPENTGGNLQSE